MKIQHVNDSETDTDKLPDIDAQILEVSESLRKLCEENHRPFISLVSPSGRNKYISFWNIRGHDNTSEAGINIGPMMMSLNDVVVRLSKGQMSIQPADE